MGFPLGPVLANIFLSHHEENSLNKYPIEFKPGFYRRYVDTIFVLFESPESAHLFREYMSSKHRDINITVEQENIGSLSFLDVKICCKNDKFVTSAYRKPTFSGNFTIYESFIPTYQKRGLLYTLLLKDFTIYKSFIPTYQKRGLLYTLLHKSFSKAFLFEIDHLKTILLKSNYPPNFIDS